MTQCNFQTPERFANPETTSTPFASNLCAMELLKADWNSRQVTVRKNQSGKSAAETIIDNGSRTSRVDDSSMKAVEPSKKSELWRASGTNVGESAAKRLLQDSVRNKR